MKIRLYAVALCLLPLPTLRAQLAPVPFLVAPNPMPPRPTERPDPADVAKLKGGPSLPYKVDTSWPQLPKGYNFGECSGVDVDKQGNVWVFNRGNWPLIKFDRSGKMLQAWPIDTLRMLSAHGLRVGPDGNLWLTDVKGHVVFKVDPDSGHVLMIIGNRQGTPGNNDTIDAFNEPTNVAFKANGNVLVSDGYVNARVAEFTAEGLPVRQWGTPGTGDGQFNLVHDIVIDSKGLIYVADRRNERIQVFDENGKFLAKWTNIGAPWGLAYVAKENAIYMCDGKYDRIIKLGLDGQVLGTLSEYGKTPGKLDYVHSIAVDPSDSSLYTVEIKTWRVQKWVRTSR